MKFRKTFVVVQGLLFHVILDPLVSWMKRTDEHFHENEKLPCNIKSDNVKHNQIKVR